MPKVLEVAPPRPAAATPVVTKPIVQPAPATDGQAAKPAEPPRPIYYHQLTVNGVIIPRENLKFTVTMAKDFLGFETEEQYAERNATKTGKGKEFFRFRAPGDNDAKLSRAPEWQFKGPSGEKCMCWRNANNRPLTMSWVEDLADDILHRRFLFNCETVIISKTRRVESAQHRCIALVWAWMLWKLNYEHWKRWWPEEPYIETLVACGADETPEVLMTLDNTLARTEADNFYTSDLIDWTKPGPRNEQVALSSVDKNTCAKMLEAALNFIWNRTGAGGDGKRLSLSRRHKTSSTSYDFVKKHSTLLKCVRHIWEENGGSGDGKAIQAVAKRFSPGQCAGMLYLMASGASDGDHYRRHNLTDDRTEERIDWSLMAKAKEFFSVLAASDPDMAGGNAEAKQTFRALRWAMGKVIDPKVGEGGTQSEHAALIAKSWFYYRTEQPITPEALTLRYDEERDSEGNLKSRTLAECPLFNVPNRGIDLGEKVRAPGVTDRAPSPDEVRDNEQSARRRRENEQAEQFRQSQRQQKQPQGEAIKAKIAEIKESCGGKLVIVCAGATKLHMAFGTDAMILAKTCGLVVDDSLDPCKLVLGQPLQAKAHLDKIAATHDNVVIAAQPVVPRGDPREGKYEWTPLVKVS